MNEEIKKERFDSLKGFVSKHPIWSVVIALFLVGFLVSAVGGDSNTPVTATQPTTSIQTTTRKVGVGEQGILNYHTDINDCSQSAIVAIDEATFNAVVKSGVANDTYGLAEYVANGKAFLVPNCTKVLVIDRNTGSRKIRVSEGEMINKTGWVAMEFVK